MRIDIEEIHADTQELLREKAASILGITPERLESKRLPVCVDGRHVRELRNWVREAEGDVDVPIYVCVAPEGSTTVALGECMAAWCRTRYH